MNKQALNALTRQYKLVMCGCHESGWTTIRYLLEQGVHFDAFVSLTAEQAERYQISGYQSFADLAEQYQVPLYYVEKYNLKAEADLAFFRERQFDLLIQGGWQRLFPETVLDQIRLGAIGGHGSADLLPRGRGRSPVNWSLIEGRQRFIMQYFLIQAGIDDGDVFHAESFDITPWDDCRTLYYKIALITQKSLLKFIPKLLAQELQLRPQQGTPTHYPKRTPADGELNWEQDLYRLHDFIRALTHPYPGAFTFLDGQIKVYFWRGQPFDTRLLYPDAAIGEVVEILPQGELLLQASGGLLMISEWSADSELEIQQGHRFMSLQSDEQS